MLSLAATSIRASAPQMAPARAAVVTMGPMADAAQERMLFRLEYNVFNLADKLGMKAPHRVPSYSDEDWINVLEEVTPYMERQWSSAARAKDEELIAYPEDALEPMQRFALRERYVQRLEAQITALSQRNVAGGTRDVADYVSRVPSYALRATDESYIEELEEVASLLRGGRFYTASSSVW